MESNIKDPPDVILLEDLKLNITNYKYVFDTQREVEFRSHSVGKLKFKLYE